MNPRKLPEQIASEEELEDVLTRPSAALVEFIKSFSSPLLILGAGGKMGPTLALLAKRAADTAGHRLEVVAVSRFSDERSRQRLESRGLKCVSGDLLQAQTVKTMPDSENVIYLVGLKFGTASNPAATWAINTIVPARVTERYPQSRIVALSTGNVYPLSEVAKKGSKENDPLTPLGEYANAAVARERIFEFYSRSQKTPLTLLRLFYAVELRYGVLVDIARKIQAGEPIDLTNGYFNWIWQGDANDMVLRAASLALSPPTVWNLCRPAIYSVRDVASRFGELLQRPPRFTGTEAPTALLGNAAPLTLKLGDPFVSLETASSWIAQWVRAGGCNLGKPTHFEVRDGNY